MGFSLLLWCECHQFSLLQKMVTEGWFCHLMKAIPQRKENVNNPVTIDIQRIH